MAGDTVQSQTRVFYNRMPKCGSRTVQDIMRNISLGNDFTFVQLPDDGRVLTEPDQVPYFITYNAHLQRTCFVKQSRL